MVSSVIVDMYSDHWLCDFFIFYFLKNKVYIDQFKEFMRRIRNPPHKYMNLMKTTNLIKTPKKPLLTFVQKKQIGSVIMLIHIYDGAFPTNSKTISAHYRYTCIYIYIYMVEFRFLQVGLSMKQVVDLIRL